MSRRGVSQINQTLLFQTEEMNRAFIKLFVAIPIFVLVTIVICVKMEISRKPFAGFSIWRRLQLSDEKCGLPFSKWLQKSSARQEQASTKCKNTIPKRRSRARTGLNLKNMKLKFTENYYWHGLRSGYTGDTLVQLVSEHCCIVVVLLR